MRDPVYIVAGDEMKKLMVGTVPEDRIIPFREDLSKGSYDGFQIDEEFIAKRAAFWGVSADEYKKKLLPIIQLDMSETYILRFGTDACCKANLEFVIGWLKKKGYTKPLLIQLVDEYDLRVLKEYELPTESKGNEEIRITEAELTEDVLNELIRMSEEWEAEQSCYGYRKNERTDIVGNRIFLACVGTVVAGYLFGHVEKSEKATSIMPDGTPFFEVEEIYVRPTYRGHGIGKQLFEYAEQAATGEAEYMMLSTATKNWKAILHFYIDELEMSFWSARLFKKIGR